MSHENLLISQKISTKLSDEYCEDMHSHFKLYKKWFDKEIKLEYPRSFCWFTVYGVPFFMCMYEIYRQSFDISHEAKMWFYGDIITRFIIACLFEPFLFVVTHVYIHVQMLLSIQCDYIGFPQAYFHHYTDSSLYSKTCFGHRFSSAAIIPFASLFAYLLGVDHITYCFIQLLNNFDILIHEWYHTNDKKYVSYNPFSPKFVGTKYIMQLCTRVGLIDTTMHKDEHHKERIHNIHLSADWIDLKMPFVTTTSDKLGEFLWWLESEYLIKPITGSTKATPCLKLTKWTQIFLISLPAGMVMTSLFSLITLITSMCVNLVVSTNWAPPLMSDMRVWQFTLSSLFCLSPCWSLKSFYEIRCNSEGIINSSKKCNHALWEE